MKHAATPETIQDAAQNAVNILRHDLQTLLGVRYVVKATFSQTLGKSIHLRIVDTTPINGIDHNSRVFSQFIMHLTGSFGQDTPLPVVSWEASAHPRSVKFRKVSSKISIEDATNKLVNWFKKNKESFDSLLAES